MNRAESAVIRPQQIEIDMIGGQRRRPDITGVKRNHALLPTSPPPAHSITLLDLSLIATILIAHVYPRSTLHPTVLITFNVRT